MISKEQLLEVTIAWAKAELAADDCGAVVRALYRACASQPEPIPESEKQAIRDARAELTATSDAGDAAFERMRQVARQYVEEQLEAGAAGGTSDKAVAAS